MILQSTFDSLGYILREDGLFLREYLSSPFLSLIEQSDNVLTCKAIPHYLLQKLADRGLQVRQVVNQPIWLQIVHDTNVRNSFDINSVIQPLSRLNKNFVAANIPADYLQSSYFNACLSFLSRLSKNKRIPLQKKIRNILTMVSSSTALTYLRFSLTMKMMISQTSKLSTMEAKQLCKQSSK